MSKGARPPRRHSRKRPAIALLAALFAGCVGGPATSGPSIEPTGSPGLATATPPAAATPTTAPSPTPMPQAPSSWQVVPPQAEVSGDQFQDVAWTGERFVALGISSLLVSLDGQSWDPQEGFGGSRLGVGPRGIVAIDGQAAHTSPDGLIWTTSEQAFTVPGIGDHTVTATDVIATDDGWLAVGREDPACQVNCGIAPIRAIVWTSADGLRWTVVTDQASFRDAGMRAVTRGGPGYVAVGQAGDHGAVWTSLDGETWSRVPNAAVFGAPDELGEGYGATMAGVASIERSIVAVGHKFESGAALAWWSADGREWSRGRGDRFEGGQLFSVAAVPGGFLATGPSGIPSCRGGIWSSADGRDWQCVASDPAFEGFAPYAAAASSSIAIAAGLGPDEGADGAFAGAIWYRGLP